MKKKSEEWYYAQWLCSLLNMNGRALSRLEEAFKSPAEVFEASEKILTELLTPGQKRELLESRKKYGGLLELKAEYDGMEERGIHFVWYREPEFPERLRQIPDPPLGLYYKGRLPAGDRPSAAIVGARECSAYGSYVAAELGKYLGRQGVEIISGMARGIDGISQEAALLSGGSSYGVLGCGADICYPASNRTLYEKLIRQGGIISAYPPGTQPLPRNFPSRNRIVSGLADAVVVVEARMKSGTLITVDMALEQGREVYAVPGRVTDRLSDGCNSLIKQGAGVLLSPEEFLTHLREISAAHRNVQYAEKEGKGAEDKSKENKAAEGEKAESKEAEDTEGIVPQRRKQRKKQQVRRQNKEMGRRESRVWETKEPEFDGELRRVYECLSLTPCSVERIKETLKDMECARLNTLLMRLCMEGAAAQVSAGYFVKT